MKQIIKAILSVFLEYQDIIRDIFLMIKVLIASKGIDIILEASNQASSFTEIVSLYKDDNYKLF